MPDLPVAAPADDSTEFFEGTLADGLDTPGSPSAAKERAERFASRPYPTGRTESGRTVIVCYCGGGDIHEKGYPLR